MGLLENHLTLGSKKLLEKEYMEKGISPSSGK